MSCGVVWFSCVKRWWWLRSNWMRILILFVRRLKISFWKCGYKLLVWLIFLVMCWIVWLGFWIWFFLWLKKYWRLWSLRYWIWRFVLKNFLIMLSKVFMRFVLLLMINCKCLICWLIEFLKRFVSLKKSFKIDWKLIGKYWVF